MLDCIFKKGYQAAALGMAEVDRFCKEVWVCESSECQAQLSYSSITPPAKICCGVSHGR